MKTQTNLRSKKAITAGIISVVTIAAIAAAIGLSSQVAEKKVILVDGQLPALTVDDLTKKARFIIIGTVAENSEPIVSVDDRLAMTKAYTDVIINVDRDLKGEYSDKQIKVRVQGGETDTTKVVSEIDPVYNIGERVLVFVNDKEPSSVWGDNYYTAGMALGKYRLVNGKAIGEEYPDGIDETTFVSEILKAMTTN